MAVADTENPVTKFAALGLIFVEEEPDTPLGIIVLPLLGADGHAERGGQEPSNLGGGVGVEGDMQNGWACECLHRALVPLYHGSLDSELLEKTDDIHPSRPGLLRKKTTVDYQFKGAGAPRQLVHVNRMRHFQQSVNEIKALIGRLGSEAELLAREIVELGLQFASNDPDEAQEATVGVTVQQAKLTQVKQTAK